MILVGLGSNLAFCGKAPCDLVQEAMGALQVLGTGGAASSLYQSAAWPDPADPFYINAVLAFEQSDLGPAAFLQALHATEDAFGRERAYLADPAQRYAPRTLDLDLLAYHDCQEGAAGEAGLVLPHPAIAERDFVLLPLVEIAPAWQHPVLQQTALALWQKLEASGRAGGTKKLDERAS